MLPNKISQQIIIILNQKVFKTETKLQVHSTSYVRDTCDENEYIQMNHNVRMYYTWTIKAGLSRTI